jgi:hypothetical protein
LQVRLSSRQEREAVDDFHGIACREERDRHGSARIRPDQTPAGSSTAAVRCPRPVPVRSRSRLAGR